MKLPRSDRRFFTDPFSRIVTAAVLGLSSVIPPAVAQTPPPAPAEQSPPPVSAPPVSAPPAAQTLPAAPEPVPQKPVYSISDLEYILGPIALYPDPLLAVLLPATAFPEQIADVDQWIAANPDKVRQGNFAEIDAKPLDTSVQALARFPDVIEMLTDHMDWTESLGMAFALQPDDVGTTIQMLRAKAEKAGNLQTTPQQVVTTREDSGSRVIYIQPASPERIYVPMYDPVTVFDTVMPGALMFGTGIIVGSIWNDRWGWNNRHWNQVWVHPPAWHWRPPPPNWGPPHRPGRPPGARPPGAWRPDRPGGIRPDRPGIGRPDRPGIGRPDRPGIGRPDRPGLPGSRPDFGNRPDRPNLRPDRPPMPGAPGAIRPDRPSIPNRPGAGIDRPGVRPDRPAIPNRPGAGAQRPDRPQVQRPQGGQRPQVQRPQGQRPQVQRPQAQRPNVNRPANIQRPQAARPQARPQMQPRPQMQARPQVRPQQARPQVRPPAARPAAPPRPQGGGGPRRPQRP